MKANKKHIQQQLSQETGNTILLKDLSNIATAHKKEKSRNDLNLTVEALMDKHGGLHSAQILLAMYCNSGGCFNLWSWHFFYKCA